MIEDRGTVKVSVNELKRLYTALSDNKRIINVVKAALVDMGNNELANVLSEYNLECEMDCLRRLFIPKSLGLLCNEYKD